MSAKAKQLIIIYTVSALAVLSVLSAVLYARLSDYRLAASYGSAQAFETTVSAVDGMSLALKKSLYATDEVLGRILCSQVYAKALAAEASMSSLPFSTQELEQLSAFLNKAGDYARSLCAQGDNELSEQQRRQRPFCAELAKKNPALPKQQSGMCDCVSVQPVRRAITSPWGRPQQSPWAYWGTSWQSCPRTS